MGVDVGTTDLHLAMRIGDTLHYFYLELKTKEGKLGKSQVKWNQRFDENFAADNAKRAVAYGFADAKKTIDEWIQSLYALKTINKEI